jgi:hypothetical protein
VDFRISQLLWRILLAVWLIERGGGVQSSTVWMVEWLHPTNACCYRSVAGQLQIKASHYFLIKAVLSTKRLLHSAIWCRHSRMLCAAKRWHLTACRAKQTNLMKGLKFIATFVDSGICPLRNLYISPLLTLILILILRCVATTFLFNITMKDVDKLGV